MTIHWLKHQGTLFPIHQGDCLLGRGADCVIVLTSTRVSREHAVVRRVPGGLEIEDLESRNGTWINGERLRGRRLLGVGDRVQVGDDILEVVVKPGANSPATQVGMQCRPEMDALLETLDNVPSSNG
jgi:pSer/pThr/pTyr-binding forkhead associated (FHA) protein